MSKIICFSEGISIYDAIASIIDINDFTDREELFVTIYKPEYILNKIHILPLQDIKAVLFEFRNKDLEEKAKLAKVLDEYYTKKKIPFYCCTWSSTFLTAQIFSAIDEHGEEKVKEHIELFSTFISFEEDGVGYATVCREHDEYCITMTLHVPYSQSLPVPSVNIVFSRLPMVPNTAKQDAMEEKVKASLIAEKPRNFIYAKNDVYSYVNKARLKRVEKLLELKALSVDVAVIGFTDYCLAAPDQSNGIETDFFMNVLPKSLLCVENVERPPFTKTIICYEPFKNLMLCKLIQERFPGRFGKVCKYPAVKIGTSLSLSVDKYFMPNVKCSKKLNTSIENGVIISFADTKFTVELIKNGILQKINLNNIPMMVGFYDGKIQVGHEAADLKKDHNSFVVSDILQFMAADLSHLKTDPNWGFKVTKNAEDKILLEFDTFRGRRKTSPSFLCSIILKWAIKSAEEKAGTNLIKPIIIWYKSLDNSSHYQLSEACKIAQISIDDVQIQRYKIAAIKDKL